MQHLLDNPGLVTALVTLILAVAAYISVKTEQARQGVRLDGLQKQADQAPPPVQGLSAAPQQQAPQVATTVLTLPANGTAVHIEAVRASTPPAAPQLPADGPPTGPGPGPTALAATPPASAEPLVGPSESGGPNVTYASGPPTP